MAEKIQYWRTSVNGNRRLELLSAVQDGPHSSEFNSLIAIFFGDEPPSGGCSRQIPYIFLDPEIAGANSELARFLEERRK
jgi:hypothetical protein